jgi:nitroreductase
MPDALELLLSRNSAPLLREPAPEDSELEVMFRAATRAPDHAWLRPWRFVTIAGAEREGCGEVLEESLRRREPDAAPAALEKVRKAPLRAPMIIVVIARITEHPKVPPVEQRCSAACAAHGILLAAEALGYAGIWRTGAVAFDDYVAGQLGCADNEEIIGFLYIGTRAGPSKGLPELDVGEFVTRWAR